MIKVLRALAFILGLALITGFGICGLCGVIGGLGDDAKYGSDMLLWGAVGLALAGAILYIMIRVHNAGLKNRAK